jgi:hypothetical protein
VKFIVIVTLETDMTPQTIINEIRSQVEFEPATHTDINSIVVPIDDATEVGIYEKGK